MLRNENETKGRELFYPGGDLARAGVIGMGALRGRKSPDSGGGSSMTSSSIILMISLRRSSVIRAIKYLTNAL